MRPKWPLMALLLAAVGLWAAAMLAPRSSAARPLAFTIDYVRDDDSGKANWAVASKQAPLPPSWGKLGEWERGVLPYSGRTRWLIDAPLLNVPTASVEVVGETREGGSRRVRLRLSSGGANVVALRLPEDVAVRALGLPGRLQAIDPDADKGPSVLRCSGRACDGMVVELDLATAKPVQAIVIATSFGLPPQGRKLLAMRPRQRAPAIWHRQQDPRRSIHPLTGLRRTCYRVHP